MKWLIKYLSGPAIAIVLAIPMTTTSAQSLPVDISKTSQAPLQVGETRPGFQLRDLQGRYRDISEWDGKLIVLNFWATWCPPCLHEIPTFSRLHNELAEDGLQFLGVALDNPRDVRRFIKASGMSYPTLYGDKDAALLSKIYGNKHGGLPYTVIIDRDGAVLSTHLGELQRDQLLTLIQSTP